MKAYFLLLMCGTIILSCAFSHTNPDSDDDDDNNIVFVVLTVLRPQVWTVPSSAAFVTFTTHVFTLVAVCAYAAAAVWLTAVWLTAPAWLASTTEDNGPSAAGRRFWTAYERTLMALVACTAFAVAGRRQLMTVAGDRYAAARETAYVASVVDTCHAHEHVGALTTVTAFAAAVRAYALEWSSSRSPVV